MSVLWSYAVVVRSARPKIACERGCPINLAYATAGLHVAVVDYNWNRHGRIIDIGGAYGSFLATILAKHAKPQGVLFDQSQACHSLPTSADLALAPGHPAARHGTPF